jgi:hypothetical protein
MMVKSVHVVVFLFLLATLSLERHSCVRTV